AALSPLSLPDPFPIFGGACAAAAQRLTNAAQHFIASDVAVLVVVGLEIVDVDHQQRQFALIAQGAAPLDLQVFVEVAAVGQAGRSEEHTSELQSREKL